MTFQKAIEPMTAPCFDEMNGAEFGRHEAPRALYSRIARWLESSPPGLLDSRRQQAELLFRRIGITFAVYGDKEAAERLIPFDIIPRLLGHDEWRRLEAGLIQRVKALNMFLTDVYGAQEIIRAGLVPEDLVFRNPAYRPEMQGRRVPHDIWTHIAGIDVIRLDDQDFYVLEDNCRTPSGVSYMLENREMMIRLAPDLFADHRVLPVENYPDALLASLRSVAPPHCPGEPSIVVLTPGQYNSAYYEHSFLADKLGVELVEGRDLVVTDDVVYMRTTEGLKRVDVIYRRVDDDFIDPLAFRPNSALGAAGLMGAYLAGNVTLANAIGAGVADDKAIYTYMPEIIRFYLGEEPKLKNVATWRCREPDALKYVLDHLSELVVKEVNGSGGYGMLVGTPREQGADRGLPPETQGRAGRLHRPADPVAFDLPDLVFQRRRAAPRRSSAFRAFGRRWRAHRARRPHPRRAQGGLAGGQFEPGRRHQGHLGS